MKHTRILTGRTHGTERTYRAGCACDTCRIAQVTRVKAWRERKLAQNPGPDDFTHGITGYTVYRCKCEICLDACRRNARLYRKHGSSAGRL